MTDELEEPDVVHLCAHRDEKLAQLPERLTMCYMADQNYANDENYGWKTGDEKIPDAEEELRINIA